ncbi:MAG: DUF5953 family protein [Myxococcota bacterium]
MGCSFFADQMSETQYRSMLEVVEAVLPTPPLVYRIDTAGQIHQVDEPAAWFMAHLNDSIPTIFCNGLEDDDEYVGLSVIPQPSPEFRAMVDWPWTEPYVERVFDLVRAFGPVSQAIWGAATMTTSGAALGRGAGRQAPIPEPDPLRPFSLRMPNRADWIAYWSEATCAAVDFGPDDARAGLFYRVEWLAGHGVVWQLTADSLDVDRPEHLAAVSALYRAFPAL